jgi:Holliday junction resolvase-like predicted endonuclease
MDKTVATREHQRLLEIACEYRQQGYSVTLDPTDDQLPDFLAPFQIDMIAHHPKEKVVVEVRSQASLQQAPELDAIAKAVQGKVDWRFELVVTNPKDQKGFQAKDATLLERNDINYRLQEARTLAQQEYGEAAFLLTWSVLEAVLRRVAQSQKIDLIQDTPLYLLKSLFTYGLLNQEQYQTLQKGFQTRNLLVHGYKTKQSFVQLLNDLLLVADQLVTHEAPAFQ